MLRIIILVYLAVGLVDGQYNSSVNGVGRPGKPGEEGPKGEAGPRGSKGEPGQCDSNRLSRFRNELDDLESKLVTFTRCHQLKFRFPYNGQTSTWIKPSNSIPAIRQITICAWVTPSWSRLHGALVSYATSYEPNDLLLYFENRIEVSLKGNEMFFDVTIGSRTHICVMVNAIEAEVKYYQNGRYQGLRTTAWFHGGEIQGGGSFLIGQEQDSVGGSLEAGQAFDATVENFYLWYRELDSSDIRSIYNGRCSCPNLPPDIDLREGQVNLRGNIARQNVQGCN